MADLLFFLFVVFFASFILFAGMLSFHWFFKKFQSLELFKTSSDFVNLLVKVVYVFFVAYLMFDFMEFYLIAVINI